MICDTLPEPAVMQKVAAKVGYSETVFAAPEGDAWRVRYFAPEVEVDFCGHATIALGAALARHAGPGLFTLDINRARITVEGHSSDTSLGAAFQSPPTRSGPVAAATLTEALDIFGLSPDGLDPRIPPAVAHGGGDHLILALKDREALREMKYDFLGRRRWPTVRAISRSIWSMPRQHNCSTPAIRSRSAASLRILRRGPPLRLWQDTCATSTGRIRAA